MLKITQVVHPICVSKKVRRIKSATNAPGAISFICLDFCGTEHATENRLSCSDWSENADLIKTLIFLLFRTALKFFQLKLSFSSVYVVYTFSVGHKAVYDIYTHIYAHINVYVYGYTYIHMYVLKLLK